LQERRVRPVGGQDEIAVDVRLLSASNQDLKAEVEKGAFREDLYYRLQVVTVLLPPLRERKEDIPLLARHFLELHCRTLHAGRKIMSPEVLAAFMGYDWPGNVRELENEVKRAIALADEIITPDVVSPHVREGTRSAAAASDGLPAPTPGGIGPGGFRDLTRLVEDVERAEIARAMDETRRNKTKAASLLGISRFTLQRKLMKYAFPDALKSDTDGDALADAEDAALAAEASEKEEVEPE
jgi:DNA-binding NtrC family response regulator